MLQISCPVPLQISGFKNQNFKNENYHFLVHFNRPSIGTPKWIAKIRKKGPDRHCLEVMKIKNLPWGARWFIDRVTNLLSRAIANFLHRYVTLFYLLGGDAFLKSYLAALLKYVVAYLKLGYFTYTQWNFIFIFLASEGPVHIICFSNWNSSMIHNGVKYSQTWL